MRIETYAGKCHVHLACVLHPDAHGELPVLELLKHHDHGPCIRVVSRDFEGHMALGSVPHHDIFSVVPFDDSSFSPEISLVYMKVLSLPQTEALKKNIFFINS